MLCLNSLLQMSRLLFLFVLLLSVLKHSDCQCIKKNSCECVFKNGSVVDLSSLGNEYNKARFENRKARTNDSYSYFYNPCFSFMLGNGDCAKGVSICQVSLDEKNYFDIGDTDSVHFSLDNNSNLVLMYSASPRMTNVTLVCSEDTIEPELTVLGEVIKERYVMTLKSRCACPNLCHPSESHLSTGSVLVIIFLIFVSLYLFLGIVHSSLTRGARGWELLPHYEFWVDFPLLVRDGCVFVVSGCKPETAYERI